MGATMAVTGGHGGRHKEVEMLQPFPQLRRNDKAHPVPTLQYLLRAQGHVVAVDGDFGPKTDGAVRSFQQKKNLTVDGIVGPVTWEALLIEVRKGDTGDAVRGVQEEFQYRNLSDVPTDGLAVDGQFGPATDAAVRGWQKFIRGADDPSMTVDGIVGPKTWQSLISGMYAG
jgi:hypothetical protein